MYVPQVVLAAQSTYLSDTAHLTRCTAFAYIIAQKSEELDCGLRMLVGSGAVCYLCAKVDSRSVECSNVAKLVPSARFERLTLQRKSCKSAYRHKSWIQTATTTNAAHKGSSSGHLDNTKPRTYDVPVVPQNIDVRTFLIKVLLRALMQMLTCKHCL